MAEVGRPTAYDPKYCDEIIEYFGVKPYETINGKQVAADTPTLAGFACKIGVHRDTLHEWTQKHPDFSDAVKRAKAFQESFLIVNGNKGLINPALTIFTLKNHQGYRDKQPGEDDRTITHKYSDKSDEELDRRLKELEGDE